MAAVTLADAARAAASHLSPSALVVVGRADDVKPLLANAGFAVDDVVPYADPVSPAERRAIAAEKAKAQAVTGGDADSGRKLLDAALAAKGGAPALQGLKLLAFHGKGTMTMQGQTMPIKIDQWVVPGRGNREELSVGPMKIVKVLDGQKGFMKQGDRLMEMPPQVAGKAARGLWRQADLILLHATEPGVKVRGLPPVSENGATLDVLEVIAADGDVTRLFLDSKTHLLTRLTYKTEEAESREEFADYRPESGIAVARTMKASLGDAVKIEVTFDSVEVNKPIPPNLFDR